MHVSLCGKRTCARIQAQEAPSEATMENETETVPRQRTLSDEVARCRRLLAARMSSDAAANGTNLLQLGAVGPQTRLNYASSLLKFEIWMNQREAKAVTDAEIDAAMSAWMEAEFMKGNPVSSREQLVSAWMDKFPSLGRHGARKLPNTWRSLQDWQRHFTWSLTEALGASGMVGDCVQKFILVA